jgi:uncharacterized protein with von Willebrand factor type A (vWA) domain
VPDPPPAALDRLVGFGRFLRGRGLPVGTGRILTFCRAATALGPFDREDLRWTARATLVSRREDLEVLDRAFDSYFARGPIQSAPLPLVHAASPKPPSSTNEPGTGMAIAERWSAADAEDDVGQEEAAIRIVASSVERLQRKDFAEMTEEERRAAFAMIRTLALPIPLRPSRRRAPASRGSRLDLRRTLRRSLRTEGEPFQRAWTERRTRRRPLVLLLDVSGSMSPYARPLVLFAHAVVLAGGRAEAFCFGTRLTRISRSLRTRDPGKALAAAGRAVGDWEGGTRIGDSLGELLERWSSRSGLRGSVVVLCSDGLERGDPEVLRKHMARLGRLAHRVVWVNPLKGSPRYEPLARGMAASLPYVDTFLPGHNLESLAELAGALAAADRPLP